jgi:hypothetical protein
MVHFYKFRTIFQINIILLTTYNLATIIVQIEIELGLNDKTEEQEDSIPPPGRRRHPFFGRLGDISRTAFWTTFNALLQLITLPFRLTLNTAQLFLPAPPPAEGF